MNVTGLAILEAALLVGGAFAARQLSRWISKGGDAKVVLMASVAGWFILFGMVPFLVFALFVKGASVSGEVDRIEGLILNLIPFALVAAPIIGFGDGMLRRKRIPGAR